MLWEIISETVRSFLARFSAADQGNTHGYWEYTARQLEVISQSETQDWQKMAGRDQIKTFSFWSHSEDSYYTWGQELCFLLALSLEVEDSVALLKVTPLWINNKITWTSWVGIWITTQTMLWACVRIILATELQSWKRITETWQTTGTWALGSDACFMSCMTTDKLRHLSSLQFPHCKAGTIYLYFIRLWDLRWLMCFSFLIYQR